MKKIYRIVADCEIGVTVELDEEDDDAAMVAGVELLQSAEDRGDHRGGNEYGVYIRNVRTKHAWIRDVENEDEPEGGP